MPGDFSADGIGRAVLDFSRALALSDDVCLTLGWPGESPPGVFWHGYDADLREVTYLLDLRLCALTEQLAASLPALSRAQRILAQHHLAFRDFCAAMAGVTEDEFDRTPAPNEWSLREIVHHVANAEMGFSLLIGWAVDRQRSGEQLPIRMPREEMEPHYATVTPEGALDQVLGRYERQHGRIQRDLADLRDADLEAPNVWWEEYEIPAWFRLHRLAEHLREHTIQVEKTRLMLGCPPTESQRLARLLHRSLAALESVLLAAPALEDARLDELAAAFNAATEALAVLTENV